MLAFLVLAVLTSGGGVVSLALMFVRAEPLLGAVGLMLLCGSGTAAAAYGVLSSAG